MSNPIDDLRGRLAIVRMHGVYSPAADRAIVDAMALLAAHAQDAARFQMLCELLDSDPAVGVVLPALRIDPRADPTMPRPPAVTDTLRISRRRPSHRSATAMSPEQQAALDAERRRLFALKNASYELGEAMFLAGWTAGQAAQQATDAELCRRKVRREAGYGGQWEGYGPHDGEMTGSECAAVIEAQGIGE